jgi:hypothetical protein
MPTWVASSAWGAYVADCGPYLGPPLRPPSVAALATFDDPHEVDYYISSDTAANVIAQTDFLPFEARSQQWTSPTTKSSHVWGDRSVPGTPHLFVIYYAPAYAWPHAAPAVDALTLVPASYATGGTLTLPAPTLALPVGNIDIGALAPSPASATVIGLPVGNIDLGSPAATLGRQRPGGGGGGGPVRFPVGVMPDVHVATLYDVDGLTRITQLYNARGIVWTEESSKPGWGTFEVPLSDASTAEITWRRIVQLAWFHHGIRIATFAVRIESEAIQLAVDGTRWLRFEQQPGLLSMLGEATVYPEYGMSRHSPATRIFGPMAAPGNWIRNGDWHRPNGYPLSEETTYRKKHPPELVKANPDWIAAGNVQAAVPEGARNFFRATYFAPEDMFGRVIATGDNYLTLCHNGTQIISPDLSNPLGWRNATVQTIYMQAGEHVFEAEVENGPFPASGGRSPIGFIFALQSLDHSGKVTGTVLKSNTTDWLAHDDTPEPGWTRAQILRTVVIEAQNRGVDACTYIRLGFTDFHDTNGLAWSDIDSFSFDVGTVSLVEVATQLTEAKMDVVLRPSAMTLYAWKRRGQDLTSTVTYQLGDAGGNLKSFESMAHAPRFTTVIAQSSDTTFVETTDAAAAAASGRIETGLTLGSATSKSTAISLSKAQLDTNSTEMVTVTAEGSVLANPIPYLHFHIGDTITVRGRRNAGTMPGRVLAITVDGSKDQTRAWPEFVQDNSV